MARTPRFKVYDDCNRYVAACHFVEDAAMIVAGNGTNGFTIRAGHSRINTLWTEGEEEHPASESYDGVAKTVWDRIALAQGDHK